MEAASNPPGRGLEVGRRPPLLRVEAGWRRVGGGFQSGGRRIRGGFQSSWRRIGRGLKAACGGVRGRFHTAPKLAGGLRQGRTVGPLHCDRAHSLSFAAPAILTTLSSLFGPATPPGPHSRPGEAAGGGGGYPSPPSHRPVPGGGPCACPCVFTRRTVTRARPLRICARLLPFGGGQRERRRKKDAPSSCYFKVCWVRICLGSI